MNIKLKMTFIIIIILAFGIITGAMLNRAISQNRIRSILSKRRPEVFVPVYEKILEPDTAQSKLVRDILNKHAKRISKIHENFRKELESSFESMKAELDPILTPEQKKQLERRVPPPPPPFPSFLNRNLEKIDIDEELSALKERLGLSKDQASQVKRILEELRDQAEMMRKERVNFRGRWRVIKELEKKEKAIENILTDEQKKLYEQMKNERHKKIEEEMRKQHELMKKQGFPRF